MDLTAVDTFIDGPTAVDRDGWEAGDTFLGGGTWLFSERQPAVVRLRDLTTLQWPVLSVTEDGLEISATCTFANLRSFVAPTGWTASPLFQQCCDALLGSFKVGNVATVGGNICLSLPAGPMTSLATALDGEYLLWGADRIDRIVPAVEFITGASGNILRVGELLRSIRVPTSALTARTAFRRASLHKHGRSAAVVIGRVESCGTTVITVTASTVRPVQLRFPAPPAADDLRVAFATARPVWHEDVHGSVAWKQHMTNAFLAEVSEELTI